MAALDSQILFEDEFIVDDSVTSFERVARIEAKSQNRDMHLFLDINSDLYPLAKYDNVSLVLASSLVSVDSGDMAIDGSTAVNDRDVWRPGKGGLAEEYEYVMYGKVYRFDEGLEEKVVAYASFGGLLMALSGNFRFLSNITVGQNIYLLMRK